MAVPNTLLRPLRPRRSHVQAVDQQQLQQLLQLVKQFQLSPCGVKHAGSLAAHLENHDARELIESAYRAAQETESPALAAALGAYLQQLE